MMYAPSWVKKDRKRFWRAEIVNGEAKSMRNLGTIQMPYYTLSYLCEETRNADARAFSALMAHIRKIDEQIGTVIGIQIENETGVLGNSREVSDAANRAFAENVPGDFLDYMRSHRDTMHEDYMRSHRDTMHEDVRAAVDAGLAAGSWSQGFWRCCGGSF